MAKNKVGAGRIIFHVVLGLLTSGAWWLILGVVALIKYIRS